MQEASVSPPKPKQKFPGGLRVSLSRDPIGTMTSIAKECGDIAHFKVDGFDVFLVSSPEYVKQVFVTQHRKLERAERQKALMKPLMGSGLLSSEGDFHHRQRRMMQPAFHSEKIAGYSKVIADYALRATGRWRDDETIDIHEQMVQLALKILAKVLFDVEIGGSAKDESFINAMNSVWRLEDSRAGFLRLLKPNYRRFTKSKAILEAMVDEMVKERKEDGRGIGDLLSMLLMARDAEGDGLGMTDQQVKDEIKTVFVAAFFTTANAMAWAWHFISQNPSVEAKLHSEIETVLRGRLPTWEDFHRLTYTNQIVMETLRIRPSSWLVLRQATARIELGEYVVPTGSIIMLSQYLLHHDPRYFPNPESFVPERWTPEFKKSLPNLAYFPFGAGPRICIGEPLAWLEAVLAIATIAQKWRLQEEKEVAYRYELPLGIKSPQPVLRFENGILMSPSTRGVKR